MRIFSICSLNKLGIITLVLLSFFGCKKDPIKPSVTTQDITEVTINSAVCNGNVNDDGGSMISGKGVVWDIIPDLTNSLNVEVAGQGSGTFSCPIRGLTANSIYYVRSFATNSEGTSYGETKSFTTTGPQFGETVTDVDGNTYKTVKIGNQTWMAENLRTTKYSDGTQIPLIQSGGGWSAIMDFNTKAYCWYKDEYITYANKYGALYNWAAVMNGEDKSLEVPSGVQGVCPSGWHLPSEGEWDIMNTYLIDNGYNVQTIGQNIARALSAQSNWISSDTMYALGNDPQLNNNTGFSALPAGSRNISGNFSSDSSYASWWTTSAALSDWVPIRTINFWFEGILDIYGDSRDGYSVRCIKD